MFSLNDLKGKDLTTQIIPWVVDNLDNISDDELLSCLSLEADNTHSLEERLNYYNHPRLMRIRFGLSVNSMAKMMNSSVSTINNLENYGLKEVSKSFADTYMDKLRYLVYYTELFVQTYHTRELKSIFSKAKEKFYDTPQLIPYILIECLFRQTFVLKLETANTDNIRTTKLPEEFISHLLNQEQGA